jgi:ankyrin repeat protein
MNHILPQSAIKGSKYINDRLIRFVFEDDDQETINSIRLLLKDYDADINYTDNYGTTALMFAAAGGKINITRFLIENGADMLMKNKGGQNFITRINNLRMKDMFEQSDIQRLILSKEPSLYNSFKQNDIKIQPDIEKEFGFAGFVGDMNLF